MAKPDEWANRIGPDGARSRQLYRTLLWLNGGWYLTLIAVVLIGRNAIPAPSRNAAAIIVLFVAIASFLILTIVTTRASRRATRASSEALTAANGRNVRVPMRALQGTEWFDVWARQGKVRWVNVMPI